MAILDLKTGEPIAASPRETGELLDEQQPEPEMEYAQGAVPIGGGQYLPPGTDPMQHMAEQQVKDVGGIHAFGASAGKGVHTLLRGLGLADAAGPELQATYDALKRKYPRTTTAGEIAGEVAPFIPLGGPVAGLASTPARVAASAALGGAEGAILAHGKGEEVFGGADLGDIAKGGGIGAGVGAGVELASPKVSRMFNSLYRNIMRRNATAPPIGPTGEPSSEFAEALRSAGLDFEDVSAEAQRMATADGIEDSAMLARKQFLEEQGLIPLRAQVTGDKTDFQIQQELAKVTNRVSAALEGQDLNLFNQFENRVSATGGSANPSTSTVFDYVADRSIDLDAAISDAYRLAREAAPDAKIVRPDNLVAAIRAIAGSDGATGGLGSAARDFLRNKGLTQGRGLNVTGRVTPAVAYELRTDLNSIYDSLTPFGRQKLRDLKYALDEDVSRDVGENFFEDANAAKAKFESDLNRAKVNKFDRRNKNLVRDILENKVNPDEFLKQAVLSKTIRAEDLKQLKEYLHLDPDGVGPWNDLRAEAMQHIADGSFNVVGGDPALSRHAIEKVLNSIGPKKRAILFSPEENKFLDDMKKVSIIREPKRGTQQGKGPSAQAVGELARRTSMVPLLHVFAPIIENWERSLSGMTATSAPRIATPNIPLHLTQPVAVSAEQKSRDEPTHRVGIEFTNQK